MKKKKAFSSGLSSRLVFNLALFGFMGQIAWNVENMYFNTFLYNAVYAGASQAAINGSLNVIDAVSKMVALSAVTAVITTFIMGTLSDKVNRRKIFISSGYILWGIITAVFGFITRENTAALFGLSDEIKILTATVWIVIVMDCVMTFTGSTANDSAFNAWVTDVTTTHNRATVESILAILPLAATGVVIGLGSFLISSDNAAKSYSEFFLLLGGTVALCGIIGFVSLKDPVRENVNRGKYFSELVYGFRPSVVKENFKLYLTLAAICIYSVALQVFFPYIFIYLEHSPDKLLDFGGDSSGITPGIIAAAAAAVVIIAAGIILIGKIIDRFGKDKFVLPVTLLFSTGLILLYFAHDLKMTVLGFVPTAIGYCMIGIMLNAAIRDFTPENKAGLFQGIRMIFCVLIPMVTGPYIGKYAILGSNAVYTDEYGISQAVPTSTMFLYAGIVGIFTLIPLLIILKKGGFSVADKNSNIPTEVS